MGTLHGVVLLVFTINAFLIIAQVPGSNFAAEAIGEFINTENNQVLLNQTAGVKIPKTVSTNTVETATTGFNFVDVLRTPFSMFTTIMSFLLAPINIANSLNIPLALNLLVMTPITVAFYVSIAVWLRGGGS